MKCKFLFLFRATNIENKEMNKVKNQLTGEYGTVPDVARHYKVGIYNSCKEHVIPHLKSLLLQLYSSLVPRVRDHRKHTILLLVSLKGQH